MAVKSGLLAQTDNGEGLTFGPRGSMSLFPFIESFYKTETGEKDKDMECTICGEFVLYGVHCPTPQCSIRMHLHCLDKMRERNFKSCSACDRSWDDLDRPSKAGTRVGRPQTLVRTLVEDLE